MKTGLNKIFRDKMISSVKVKITPIAPDLHMFVAEFPHFRIDGFAGKAGPN
jgi:hypothetical protein